MYAPDRSQRGNSWENLPVTRGCFVCGIDNPAGLGLTLLSDGRCVEVPVQFRDEHCGFTGVVHGGLLSTVLDEVMAWVIGVNTRSFAFAAELNVRFLRSVPPGIPLKVRAELTANRRGRLFLTRGEVLGPNGVAYAEATGKFLPIPAAQQSAMLADFVGDPSPWIAKPATGSGLGVQDSNSVTPGSDQ
jgi:uncharacterized protein (TIGR00369 family)